MTPEPEAGEAAAGITAGLVAVGIALLSVVLMAAGVLWPHAAGALLRLLAVLAAASVVAGWVWQALASVQPKQDRYSPFDGATAEHEPATAPQRLRRLALTLEPAADPQAAERTAIPWAVCKTLVDEATRRLAERHGLNVSDSTHRAFISDLVSEPTLQLILPDATPAAGRFVPLSSLDRILSDLERL